MNLKSAGADGLDWRHPYLCPDLEPGTVHLWLADLKESACNLKQYKSYLDSFELDRAQRYAHDEARERFIASRGILKEIIAMYVKCEAKDIQFRLGLQGKPYLATQQPVQLNFNSTDSKHIALFALCWTSEVGIDVELRNRAVGHSLIAKRKLTDYEFAAYQSHADEEARRVSFLSLWTRKESYGKAKGVGVYYKMNCVNLLGENESASTALICPDGLPWEVTPIFPIEDIIACVTTAGIGWNYRGFRYPLKSTRRV